MDKIKAFISNPRFKNVYFWTGLVGVFLLAGDIDPQTLITWDLVGKAIVTMVKNPVAVCSAIMAVIGVFVNSTTKGLKG